MDPSGYAMPSMGPPRLSHHHQPLAFFGPYVPHGSGLLQPPPDYGAHAFPDHFLPDEPEAIETKKRRIARACDMCRKKKIKCDGKLPACTHCLNYKTSCVFTHVEKKRAPPKGAKYIEGLENRLGRMEHLLRLSGLLQEDEIDLGALEKRLMEKAGLASSSQAPGSPPPLDALATPAHDTSISSPENSQTQTPYSFDGGDPNQVDKNGGHLKGPEEVETLSEMMCSLVTNQSGESRYTGSSSGFSIFSPKGIQWINSKTGDDSFRRMISHVSEDDHKWTSWRPEVFGQLFQRPVFRPLPPKEEALSLLDDYFTNFNSIVPLFYRPTFLHLVERQYSLDHGPYPSTGWWASLNVTLALAHRIRVMSGVDPAEEDDKGWAYLKNAMACFSELTMRSTDLLSVQALLGMALFLRGTPNPQPTYALIAAAIRLSHGIGLHKRGTGFNLNPIEIEQRKRVFWIAYMLDKDLCLQSGQPPMQDDNDVSVELPEVELEVGVDVDGGGTTTTTSSLFRLLCEFSLIESNVYKRLYSAKASRQSDGELLNTIGELDRQLEAWKDAIPIEFRPEHPIQTSHPPLMLHLVTLHFAYFNCLTTIHRMSIQHGMWTSRLADYAAKGLNVRPLNPRVFSSAAICTSAARASIALLQYMPQGDFPCVWMILYFPVSALVTLFANILQNPLDAEARNDVKLMNLVVAFLSTLGPEVHAGGVHRTLSVCSEFCRVADIVIDRAETDHPARRKRKIPDSTTSTTSTSTSGTRLKPRPTPPADHLSPAATWSSPYLPQGSSPSLDSIAWTSPMDHNHNHHQQQQQHGNPSGYEAPEYHAHYGGLLDVPGVPQGHLPLDPFGAGAGVEAGVEGHLQQPLLPPDLFALPVSLDWTWAEMSGGAYPSVENGSLGFSDPNQVQ